MTAPRHFSAAMAMPMLLLAAVLASSNAFAQGAAPAASRVASAPAAKPPPIRSTAGSISGSTPASESAECAAARKAYLDSQACFAPYRLANGGLRAEATKRCKTVPDPSPRCGQNLPTQ